MSFREPRTVATAQGVWLRSVAGFAGFAGSQQQTAEGTRLLALVAVSAQECDSLTTKALA